MAIEPHPAMTTEAIRRERDPASTRRFFTKDIQTDEFERVFSGLQTLVR
jgi:hypothetical protein